MHPIGQKMFNSQGFFRQKTHSTKSAKMSLSKNSILLVAGFGLRQSKLKLLSIQKRLLILVTCETGGYLSRDNNFKDSGKLMWKC